MLELLQFRAVRKIDRDAWERAAFRLLVFLFLLVAAYYTWHSGRTTLDGRFWQDEQWRANYYSDPFGLTLYPFKIIETPVSIIPAVVHYAFALIENNEQFLLIPVVLAGTGLFMFFVALSWRLSGNLAEPLLMGLLFFHSAEFHLIQTGLKSGLIDVLAQCWLLFYFLGRQELSLRRDIVSLCVVVSLVFYLSFFSVFVLPGIFLYLVIFVLSWEDLRWPAIAKIIGVCLITIVVNILYCIYHLNLGAIEPTYYQQELIHPWELFCANSKVFFLDSLPGAFRGTLLSSVDVLLVQWVFGIGFLFGLIALWRLGKKGRLVLLFVMSGFFVPYFLHIADFYAFTRHNNINLHILYWIFFVSCFGISELVSYVLKLFDKRRRLVSAFVLLCVLVMLFPDRALFKEIPSYTYPTNAFAWDNYKIPLDIRAHMKRYEAYNKRTCISNLHFMLSWGLAYYTYFHEDSAPFFNERAIKFFSSDKFDEPYMLSAVLGEKLAKNCDFLYRPSYYGIGPVQYAASNEMLSEHFVLKADLKHYSQVSLVFFINKQMYERLPQELK